MADRKNVLIAILLLMLLATFIHLWDWNEISVTSPTSSQSKLNTNPRETLLLKSRIASLEESVNSLNGELLEIKQILHADQHITNKLDIETHIESDRQSYIDEDFYDLWDIIQSSQLNNEFTDYELSSMLANKAYAETGNQGQYNCKFDQRGELPACCVGSVSSGGASGWYPGSSNCYKWDYHKRMKYYTSKRTPYTSHDIFWTLPNNSKILFIGDSVQNQIFNGFECDLIRHGYVPFTDQYSKIQFYRNPEPNLNEFVSEQTVNKTVNFTNSQGIDYRYKVNYNSNGKVTFVGHRGYSHVLQVRYIRNHRAFIPFYQNDGASFCQFADIIIFNWELHYQPFMDDEAWIKDVKDGILSLIKSCFDKYNELKNKPIFIWNEAPAQHFGKIGGDYFDIYAHHEGGSEDINDEYRKFIAEFKNDPEIARNDTKWNLYVDTKSRLETKTCEPHHYFQNKTFDKHFRRLRLMDALKQNGIKMEIINLDKEIDLNCEDTLYFIPFKDYTDPLWNMHHNPDCTHWCTWPQLWEFIWDSIYRIIAKNLKT